MIRILSTALSVLVLIPALSNATSIIFGLNVPTAGSVSYAGGASPLIGTGIEVDTILGVDTALNAGTPINCNNCILDFTSGASTGDWEFGAGSISIIGGATEPGIPNGSLLLSGTFNSMRVVEDAPGFLDIVVDLTDVFVDMKAPALCGYYDAPCDDFDAELRLNFEPTEVPELGEPFSSSQVCCGEVKNRLAPIPLPAAAWLFVSAMGLLGWIKRKAA